MLYILLRFVMNCLIDQKYIQYTIMLENLKYYIKPKKTLFVKKLDQDYNARIKI